MNRRTNATWLLLGYLALLLNIGPSAHHADFFGLHGDHCGDHSSLSTCSCQHHAHDCQSSEAGGLADAYVIVDSSDQQVCGCALCEYFDCFNAIPAAFFFSLDDSPARFRSVVRGSVADASAILSNARGPPASRLI